MSLIRISGGLIGKALTRREFFLPGSLVVRSNKNQQISKMTKLYKGRRYGSPLTRTISGESSRRITSQVSTHELLSATHGSTTIKRIKFVRTVRERGEEARLDPLKKRKKKKKNSKNRGGGKKVGAPFADRFTTGLTFVTSNWLAAAARNALVAQWTPTLATDNDDYTQGREGGVTRYPPEGGGMRSGSTFRVEDRERRPLEPLEDILSADIDTVRGIVVEPWPSSTHSFASEQPCRPCLEEEKENQVERRWF